MNILITGGAGFIGTNAALRLAQEHSVTCLDNFSRRGVTANAKVLETRDVPVIKADVCRVHAYHHILKSTHVVIHLASQTAVTASVENPWQDYQDNLHGTLLLLEFLRRWNREAIILYASTNKVYGDLSDHSLWETEDRVIDQTCPRGVSESETLNFISPYGCSKGAADQYMLDYARIYGLNTVVFRQSCIYGPHQQGVEDQGWVSHFTRRALAKRPVTIYGNGKQVRDLLHVSDLVAAYRQAISNIGRARGNAYNVGGGPDNAYSLLQTMGIINRALARNTPVNFEQPRVGDQAIYVSDNAKIYRHLGWQPAVPFIEGVADLLKRQSSGNRP